jgi:hypothetical protein
MMSKEAQSRLHIINGGIVIMVININVRSRLVMAISIRLFRFEFVHAYVFIFLSCLVNDCVERVAEGPFVTFVN